MSDQKPSPETMLKLIKNKLVILLAEVTKTLDIVVTKMDVKDKVILEMKQSQEAALMAAAKQNETNTGSPQSPQAKKHGMGDH